MTEKPKFLKQGGKYIDRYAVCGQASEEHHDFEPTTVPVSCIGLAGCSYGEVCVEFRPDSAGLFCTVCSHHGVIVLLQGCHRETP